MTTFTVMTGAKTVDDSIKQWVNHSLVPSDEILTEAQAWIYQRLRVRQMLTTATGTLTASNDTDALPARYRGPKHLMFTASATLAKYIPKRKSLEFVEDNWSYDGTGVRVLGRPRYWATDEANLCFELQADVNLPYRFRHYQSLAALGTATETNFLTEEYPTILKATCMFRAYEWQRHEKEKLYWKQVAEAEIFEASKESDLELTDEELQMRAE